MAAGQIFLGEWPVHDAVDLHHFVTQVLEHPAHDSAAVAVDLHTDFVGVVFDERHLLGFDEALVQHEAF